MRNLLGWRQRPWCTADFPSNQFCIWGLRMPSMKVQDAHWTTDSHSIPFTHIYIYIYIYTQYIYIYRELTHIIYIYIYIYIYGYGLYIQVSRTGFYQHIKSPLLAFCHVFST